MRFITINLIWRFSVQRIYSGFKLLKQGYSSRKLLTFFGNSMVIIHIPCSQIWHFCVTYIEWFGHQLWHIHDWFPVISVNCDGPHVGQEISLFPEHLISLHFLGSSWFCSLWGVLDFTYNYIHFWICQYMYYDYIYRLMTGLFWTYFSTI